MTCGTCKESKNHGSRNVFCIEYGIVIKSSHPRCRYGSDRDGNDNSHAQRLPDRQLHDSRPE